MIKAVGEDVDDDGGEYGFDDGDEARILFVR